MIDKELIQQSIKRAVSDRPFIWLIALLLGLGVLCSLIIMLRIHPSDVTVYIRYSAFGEAHFYKNHWQYLIGFALFSLIVAISHSTIMVKLYSMERRQTALLVGWLGVTIVAIGLIYSLAVIGLGYAA